MLSVYPIFRELSTIFQKGVRKTDILDYLVQAIQWRKLRGSVLDSLVLEGGIPQDLYETFDGLDGLGVMEQLSLAVGEMIRK